MTAVSTDPASTDPALVRTLLQPLLALRASLGTGTGVPDPTVVRALSNSSTQVAETEAPHRDGMHALESTWAGRGADAAVPALRTTQTQIGDISDRGPAYLAVLTDAHATSARASQQVDAIIADFRRDARSILNNATAAPDTDAVITRATLALRQAITVVTAAQTEMDGHTRTLDAMGPITVSQPLNASYPIDTPPRYTPQYTPGTPYAPETQGAGYVGPGGYPPPGQYGNGAPANWSGVPGGYGPPMDPTQAAQMQLQQQLIAAGVQVGSAAITAGVDIGTHLIDKIADVGTHTIDDVSGIADKAIPQLLHPGNTNGTNGSDANGGGTTTPGKVFDFGGGPPAPTVPGAAQPGGAAPAPAAPVLGPNDNAPKPIPAIVPDQEQAQSDPAPTSSAAPPKLSAPAPAPPPPESGNSNSGLAMPPPGMANDQDHKPRDGQLGVTAPAAFEEMVPAAVIGDFGDDTL